MCRLQGGLVFGIINLVGNFGTVFVDQAYWQSAIAARPSSSHKGYILGGQTAWAFQLCHHDCQSACFSPVDLALSRQLS